jgi:hypothetical protein
VSIDRPLGRQSRGEEGGVHRWRFVHRPSDHYQRLETIHTLSQATVPC